MASLTAFQKFRKKVLPEVRRQMYRMGVTVNRDTIERKLVFDLWVAETVRKSLRAYDSESQTSRQLLTPLAKNS